MEIPINQLKEWIAALDSGKYRQGGLHLQPSETTFCCLGVACKVLIPESIQELSGSGRLLWGRPSEQRGAPLWLKEIDQDFETKTGIALTTLNDSERFTFSEIATLLELVYIHRILD